MGKKNKCPKCGKKIGRADRIKLKLITKSIKTNERAKKEFEEVKDCCPKCIADFFKPRFKEAMKELKDKAIPEKFKGILKKAEKEAEK